MNYEVIEALYDVAQPRKKDVVKKMIGDFFEREAIPIYLRWIRDADEFGIYDYSESSRIDKQYDSNVSVADRDWLQYDYCLVERLSGIDAGEDNKVVSYLECKGKLFPRRNFKFKINVNSWNGYKQHSEMRKRDTTFLFGNILDGTIRTVNMAYENCFTVESDGISVDTLVCGNLLPAPYRISQRRIAVLLERIASVLGYRQQPTLW